MKSDKSCSFSLHTVNKWRFLIINRKGIAFYSVRTGILPAAEMWTRLLKLSYLKIKGTERFLGQAKVQNKAKKRGKV